MTNLALDTTNIRLLDNLYCLTDLHKLSGGQKKHKPQYFLASQQTVDLIQEIEKAEITAFDFQAVIIKRGSKGGTYACKDLIYAYAMWISSAFYLKVIRAFDALQSKSTPQQELALADQSPITTVVTKIRNGELVSTETFNDDVIVIGKSFVTDKINSIQQSSYETSRLLIHLFSGVEKQS